MELCQFSHDVIIAQIADSWQKWNTSKKHWGFATYKSYKTYIITTTCNWTYLNEKSCAVQRLKPHKIHIRNVKYVSSTQYWEVISNNEVTSNNECDRAAYIIFFISRDMKIVNWHFFRTENILLHFYTSFFIHNFDDYI